MQVHQEKFSDSVLPLWVYFLCGFAILIFVQGALRKWVFPNLATPLYVAKDAVLLGSLLLFLNRRDFRLPVALRKTALPILWGGVACIVFLQAFNLNVPSVAVGIFGIRSYLLFSVLLVLMPAALQYVRKPARLVTFMATGVVVPVLLLGMYQFTMPPGHWINQYVADEAAVDATQGLVRITGTFSYTQAVRPFLVFALAFGAGILIAGFQRGRTWYQILGMVVFGLALVVAPMNGSRGVIFGFVLAIPFILYSMSRQGQRLAVVSGICAVLLIAGFVGAQTDLVERAWGAFEVRVESAAERGRNIERVESMVQDPFRKLGVAGIMGYGAGSTQPAASALSSEGPIQIPSVGYEGAAGRVILELGIVGALLFFFLKAWILWMTWESMFLAKSAWEDIVSITAFPVALQHFYVETIVFNHVGGAIYWLCVGAAVWVWSRRSAPKARHSSRKPARSSL